MAVKHQTAYVQDIKLTHQWCSLRITQQQIAIRIESIINFDIQSKPYSTPVARVFTHAHTHIYIYIYIYIYIINVVWHTTYVVVMKHSNKNIRKYAGLSFSIPWL